MGRLIRALFNFLKEPIFALLLAFASIAAFIPVLTYAYFANTLVSTDAIMNKNKTGLILKDRTGKPFFKFYDARAQEFVPLSEIPQLFQEAIISAEDKEFYNHPGFSIKGIIGAILADIKHRNLSYGGSTITQQLVKNSLLTSKRTFLRKYQELILAQEIERRYSKPEILEMYLNSVYFGEGAFGAESAAKTYFTKSVKDLSLSESSMLAGIITAPSYLSPISGDPDEAKKRQAYILGEMVQNNYISDADRQAALGEELTFSKNPTPFDFQAPHFALMVRDELIQKYGEEEVARSGFVVTTTLDLDWQRYAENVVKEQVESLAKNGVTNGAVVVIDPKTGQIRTLVGSVSWYNDKFGKVNIASSSRQPGSSFKPLVYMTALEDHLITPATLLKDNPTTFKMPLGSPPYRPRNYDGRFRGPVLVRRALANSLNVPAVQVMEMVGVPQVLEMASRLGLTTLQDPSDYGLSMVLGAGEVKLLEMTNAYATLANRGVFNPPSTILEIKDKMDKKIFTFEEQPKKVIDPEYPFLISSILSDNSIRTEVFGQSLDISRPAAVKTGTSENYKDSLTLGYTPSLTIGVWVGNNDGTSMDRVAGSLGAAPIWRKLMEKFLEGTPVEKFELPANIVSKPVCRSNGLLAKESTSAAYLEYFAEGTDPVKTCSGGAHTPLETPSASPTPAQSTPTPPVSPSPQAASEGQTQTINIQVRGGKQKRIN
ncbi:hypothetical protein A2631_02015 [Candidatus Daviesbacteria bacterium RIFCSPHIGHO2_01_FULL_44_29]|uniref:Uncharacterized protein n=1 Tax=Candidatus Daviesbacteria bacterium RIFCSPHIGHO2_02_FULL_43_12 TaxID=1797776 RepID=A0A1F5KJU8_9BACT|nr:MAG: hypothetical protein A2631_02015 [Candidatus Daviesbacteria bacterium RIFCSPHIGHO2_01_FULL_44_29]OGE39552.1 MAG: hypothetical protein A3E86_01885 [Candidatus Daviesbacteria bacterium RIFCSPHIGHO2_12_FULL_47_45]OGE41172.1 MAG: hypothetical protein A3D25_01410 [Candidatus Daviesbacteria bacterium RIFCSPHIGHO2_02_FULL_43_12]OGE69371.1 MAG: hypothetical protein A3B55_03150 [Candidatus Daviesbacteria bacterium RIFCSPLOWO2_01_FULL_43_15]